MKVLVGLIAPAVLAVTAVWFRVWWLPKRRRLYRRHPELRPYGPRLLLRTSPFLAIAAAFVVFGIVISDITWIVLGVIALVAFVPEIAKRWQPPPPPKPAPPARGLARWRVRR